MEALHRNWKPLTVADSWVLTGRNLSPNIPVQLYEANQTVPTNGEFRHYVYEVKSINSFIYLFIYFLWVF